MSLVYRCSYKSTTPTGVQNVNTFHYQTDKGSPLDAEPDISDVAGAVNAHLKTLYKAILPSDATLTSLDSVLCVRPGSGDIPTANTISINELGTALITNEAIPVACGLLIRKKSPAATRSGRGHIVLPSPRFSGVMTANATFATTTAYWTDVLALCNAMNDSLTIGTLTVTTLRPVVYSRTRHEREDDPFTFTLTNAVPQQQPHWLRSRMSAP